MPIASLEALRNRKHKRRLCRENESSAEREPERLKLRTFERKAFYVFPLPIRWGEGTRVRGSGVSRLLAIGPNHLILNLSTSIFGSGHCNFSFSSALTTV